MREATHHELTRLQFLSDWRTQQHGEITPGGKLVVEYDTARLAETPRKLREAEAWSVEAYIRFHPSDELRKESLREEMNSSSDGPVVTRTLRPLEVMVPKDATQVELWFRSFDDVGGSREAWDSQFGQNYWFEVAHRQEAAPQARQEAAPQARQEAAPQARQEAAPQRDQRSVDSHPPAQPSSSYPPSKRKRSK